MLDLHEYIARVIQELKTDCLDDLISHIWNERDAGTVEMTDLEHLSMIPGSLLAGHEMTKIVRSMGSAHLLQHGLWEEATQSDKASRQAIEELLRYESAITGMRRGVPRKLSSLARSWRKENRSSLPISQEVEMRLNLQIQMSWMSING